MKFIYPEILWALLTLAIPILVHLFNFRKFKKVAFSNVSFLKEVKQETQSKSRLKHLLILASRLLALTALILAFAQPYFPVNDSTSSTGDKAISIYIDNSFSMESESSDGRLIDLAKNKALEIVEYYRPTDKFQLITNDFEGRHQRLVTKEEMLDLIDEVQISPDVVRLSDVVTRQRDVLNNSSLPSRTSFIVSDFQRKTHDFANLEPDSNIAIRFVPNLVDEAQNIYIDSAWFSTPVRQLNQPEELHVRIVNHGEQSLQNVPLNLSINGEQKAIGSFNVEPISAVDTSLFFTHNEPGFKRGTLALTDHPVTFDDQFHLSYEVAEQISILEILGDPTAGSYFSKIYGEDGFFDYNSVSSKNVDYSTFSNYNLLIINSLEGISSGLASELERVVANGASAMVMPHSDCNKDSYNELFSLVGASPWGVSSLTSTKVSDLNLEHQLFNGVFESIPKNIDLPVVNSFYDTKVRTRSDETTILGLQNGSPFLSASAHGDGVLYRYSVSLNREQSNLAQHAIFVTASIRMAELSQPSAKLYYNIGGDEVVTLRNLQVSGESTFHLKDTLIGIDFIPAYRKVSSNTEIFLHDQVTQASNYDLTWNNELMSVLSFNYDRVESDMDRYEVTEAKSLLANAGIENSTIITTGLENLQQHVGELDEGKKLWYTLILFALIFIAIEILLVKFWRT